MRLLYDKNAKATTQNTALYEFLKQSVERMLQAMRNKLKADPYFQPRMRMTRYAWRDTAMRMTHYTNTIDYTI